MIISDDAIIISVRKFGAYDIISKCLLRHHGMTLGVIKFAMKSSRRSDFHQGNLCKVQWQARLEDQLGVYKIIDAKHFYQEIIFDNIKLLVLNSALSMCDVILNERERQDEIFDTLHHLIYSMTESQLSVLEILRMYIALELELLKRSGFGLDLSRCKVTGTSENLCYISPKSGCAVTEEVGRKYHNKLFAMNGVFVGAENISYKDVSDAMDITLFFIEKNIFIKNTESSSRVMLKNQLLKRQKIYDSISLGI